MSLHSPTHLKGHLSKETFLLVLEEGISMKKGMKKKNKNKKKRKEIERGRKVVIKVC